MTTLRLVVEEVRSPSPSGTSRYATELTRHIIQTAPPGCDVEGIVAAGTSDELLGVEEALPGIAHLHRMALGHRELAVAWQMGLPSAVGGGLIHAPSLLAPIYRHDRVNLGDQTSVTIHDVVAWTHPESLTSARVARRKALAKRARKHADAIVVPTHAVAKELAAFVDFGDRIRVIGGAPSSALRLPADAEARADELSLPDLYVAASASAEPHKALAELVAAMALPHLADVALVAVGPDDAGAQRVTELAMEAGLPEGRVRALGHIADPDLAVVLDRAAVFAMPSRAEGFGLPLVEAMSLGTPVVHSDDAALVEVAGGAGLIVERGEGAEYAERLAEALAKVMGDRALAATMSVSGADRARAFSWRDSAERVWQLHADL